MVMSGFVVIPAVDIRGGKCVRLVRGDFSLQTVYDEDPVRTASHWASLGAEWLHIVDLDGALEGKPKNLDVLSRIRRAVRCKLQFGGGVRELGDIEAVLSIGVERVILGTTAVENKALLAEAVREYGNRIAVAVDVRDGAVVVRGWREETQLTPVELVRELEGIGVETIIYTDVKRDGTMLGPNIEGVAELVASSSSLKVIASGGITTSQHIRELAKLYPKVIGCIVGKALYEGKLSYNEAVATAKMITGGEDDAK
jgi:phosphoribosylformimino-5-aminoimidazole carboxamide ribotide isomerase